MMTAAGEDDALQISIQRVLQLFGQSLKPSPGKVFGRYYEKQVSSENFRHQKVILMLKESLKNRSKIER